MLCTILYSLVELYQRTLSRSLRSLVRFLILLNSWIKIVGAHFPWSNLYLRCGNLLLDFKSIYMFSEDLRPNSCFKGCPKVIHRFSNIFWRNSKNFLLRDLQRLRRRCEDFSIIHTLPNLSKVKGPKLCQKWYHMCR